MSPGNPQALHDMSPSFSSPHSATLHSHSVFHCNFHAPIPRTQCLSLPCTQKFLHLPRSAPCPKEPTQNTVVFFARARATGPHRSIHYNLYFCLTPCFFLASLCFSFFSFGIDVIGFRLSLLHCVSYPSHYLHPSSSLQDMLFVSHHLFLVEIACRFSLFAFRASCSLPVAIVTLLLRPLSVFCLYPHPVTPRSMIWSPSLASGPSSLSDFALEPIQFPLRQADDHISPSLSGLYPPVRSYFTGTAPGIVWTLFFASFHCRLDSRTWDTELTISRTKLCNYVKYNVCWRCVPIANFTRISHTLLFRVLGSVR